MHDYHVQRALRIAASALISSAALASGGAAYAGETRYKYDDLGRLVEASQTGASTSHLSGFQYDPAGNRIRHVVEGSANGSATGVIVSRLGGAYVVIPIDRK